MSVGMTVNFEPPLYIPAYYELFSGGGDAVVRVHFSPRSGCTEDWLPALTFPWKRVQGILNPITGHPYEVMLFDDGYWKIEEYKISMAKKRVTIVVGESLQFSDSLVTAEHRWRSELSYITAE